MISAAIHTLPAFHCWREHDKHWFQKGQENPGGHQSSWFWPLTCQATSEYAPLATWRSRLSRHLNPKCQRGGSKPTAAFCPGPKLARWGRSGSCGAGGAAKSIEKSWIQGFYQRSFGATNGHQKDNEAFRVKWFKSSGLLEVSPGCRIEFKLSFAIEHVTGSLSSNMLKYVKMCCTMLHQSSIVCSIPTWVRRPDLLRWQMTYQSYKRDEKIIMRQATIAAPKEDKCHLAMLCELRNHLYHHEESLSSCISLHYL